jgi:hypothetical protein
VPGRHVAIEYFDDGALLLDLRNQKVAALDGVESRLLGCLDGKRTLGELLDECACTALGVAIDAASGVSATFDDLLQRQMLHLVGGYAKEDGVNPTRYIQNPDVNLREEDEDGGLLYDPDSDRVRLVNSTGLRIWKICAEGRTIEEMAAYLQAEFDGVPENEVTADVDEFVGQMVESGFIGVLEASQAPAAPR